MRRFTLLFATLLCAFVAKAAVTITADGSNGVIVHADNAGELNSFNPTEEEQSLLTNSTAITLTGNFNGDDLQKLSNYGKDAKTSLDFSEAHFTSSEEIVYKDDGTGTWGPVTVNMSSQTYKHWLNVTDIKMSKHETATVTKESLFQNFNGGKPAIESIEINGTIDIEDGMFSDRTSLKTVTIGQNVGTLGTNAFKGCTSLSKLDLGGTKVIGNKAFGGCTSLTSLTIPGTVQKIVTEAFIDCDKIQNITFEEHLGANGKSDVNMTIEPLAFRQGTSIWNIYIETEGTLTCENNAFDFTTTFAHGNASAKTAVLHYPTSKIDEYCNMHHVLTYEIASDAAKFHVWLLEHYRQASDPYQNGWYEFVNSGPSSNDDEVAGGKVLRTYSFYYPVTTDDEEKPVTVAKLVPAGVKAYIVNGVTEEDGNFKVSLKSIFAVPANTGVLLYGQPNAQTENGVPSLVMNTVAFEGYPIRRDYWGKMASAETKNMLMPTCIEFDKYGDVKKDANGHEIEVKLASRGIEVKPYDTNDDNKTVRYRNFFMTKYSSTDLAKKVPAEEYVGFFRAKKSYIRSGKAFLRVSSDEYTDPNGAEAIIVKDEDYKVEYDPDDGHKINPSDIWKDIKWEATSDWGERNLPAGAKAMFFGEPEIEEYADGSATLIISAGAEQEQEGAYYTLQGVKVTKPAAGIYIKNGKKVVVK